MALLEMLLLHGLTLQGRILVSGIRRQDRVLLRLLEIVIRQRGLTRSIRGEIVGRLLAREAIAQIETVVLEAGQVAEARQGIRQAALDLVAEVLQPDQAQAEALQDHQDLLAAEAQAEEEADSLLDNRQQRLVIASQP